MKTRLQKPVAVKTQRRIQNTKRKTWIILENMDYSTKTRFQNTNQETKTQTRRNVKFQNPKENSKHKAAKCKPGNKTQRDPKNSKRHLLDRGRWGF